MKKPNSWGEKTFLVSIFLPKILQNTHFCHLKGIVFSLALGIQQALLLIDNQVVMSLVCL
ncbi:MAG: hypothetical protein MUE85_16790 [Microscillaceae bacterium]|nr:hypothetical protein [Microscillaceae bacterium]